VFDLIYKHWLRFSKNNNTNSKFNVFFLNNINLFKIANKTKNITYFIGISNSLKNKQIKLSFRSLDFTVNFIFLTAYLMLLVSLVFILFL